MFYYRLQIQACSVPQFRERNVISEKRCPVKEIPKTSYRCLPAYNAIYYRLQIPLNSKNKIILINTICHSV